MSGIGDEDLLAAIDANDLFKDVVEEEYDLDELEDDQLQSPEHNFDYLTQSAYAQERRMSAHDIQVNEMAEAIETGEPAQVSKTVLNSREN